MTGALFAVADSPDPLLNWGLPGLIVSIALGIIGALWRRDVKARDEELNEVRARALRLETELQRLNDTVYRETRQALTDATRAVAEALNRTRGST